MTISRRRFGALAAAQGLLLSPLAASIAQAQQAPVFPQPNRPIRLLVPFAAGGATDGQARSIARRITESSGVRVVVENMPGASMTIAARHVMRAQPDGHTLMYAPSSLFVQNPHTLLNLPYDPFKDFTAITMAARGPLVLVVYQGLPVQNVRDLVAWAKANPGKLNFASFGTGTSSHLFAMHFSKTVGIDVVHVPYQGTAEVVRDLFAGRVQAYFDAAPTAIQHSATGRIRMIGVAAPKRMPASPQVPTLTEQGVANMDLTGWTAIVGPAGMPPALVEEVNALFTQALNAPDVTEFIANGAWEASPSTPTDLVSEMRTDYDRWGRMVKQLGFEKQ